MENEKQNSNYASYIIFLVLLLAILGVMVFSYHKYIIKEDFILYAQVSCDPEVESCFAWQCTPEEDESCPIDPEEQVWYYKIVYKKAANAPQCDPFSEIGCPELFCELGEDSCEVINCSLENALLYQDSGSCW